MKIFKSITLILFTIATLSSCKSDDAEPITACFEDAYTGEYTVTGTVNNELYNGSVNFEKLSCTTAKFVAGDYTENITELEASDAGGYAGKTPNGSISIALDGNTIDITGSGHNFSGEK